MADGTGISWADATLNVVNGCTVVSPGCTNCYAMRLAGTRLRNHPSRAGLTRDTKAGPVWTGEVRFNEAALLLPLHWKRPRMIFWNAHGDMFHPSVPDEWIDRQFAVMALTPHHIHQVLTKRPERMRDYLAAPARAETVWGAVNSIIDRWEDGELRFSLRHVGGSPLLYALGMHGAAWGGECPWPLKNVWLGTSVEDQARADERIPALLATPAAVRWLSMEPLLGPLSLDFSPSHRHSRACAYVVNSGPAPCTCSAIRNGIDWIVVGGESGPNARPMHPDWARSIRDQCAAAGVPFHFKQHGEWAPSSDEVLGDMAHVHAFADGVRVGRFGKKMAGRNLDGVEHNGFPA